MKPDLSQVMQFHNYMHTLTILGQIFQWQYFCCGPPLTSATKKLSFGFASISESFLNELPHNFFQSLQGILWLKLSGVLWMIIFYGSISLLPLSQCFVLNIESDLLHVNQNFFKANFLFLILNQIFYMWTKLLYIHSSIAYKLKWEKTCCLVSFLYFSWLSSSKNFLPYREGKKNHIAENELFTFQLIG